MVDMAMISGAMSALKSAGDLTKLMVASHDANVIREKAIELQEQIFTAQQNALAAQSEQFDLLERVRQLEKQIADLEAWGAEKQRYKLERLASGSLVYALKAEESSAEPAHEICAACYQHGRKSILQKVPQDTVSRHLQKPQMLRCPDCKAEVIA